NEEALYGVGGRQPDLLRVRPAVRDVHLRTAGLGDGVTDPQREQARHEARVEAADRKADQLRLGDEAVGAAIDGHIYRQIRGAGEAQGEDGRGDRGRLLAGQPVLPEHDTAVGEFRAEMQVRIDDRPERGPD